MIGRFTRPYAQAFMEIVPDLAEAQKMHSALVGFETARKSSQELVGILGNPGISLDSKLKIVAAIGKRLEIPELGLRILEVLVRNQRINQLGLVLQAWREMINKATGIALAKVRTAHELSAEEREKLQRALEQKTGKRIDLEVSTDPSLLGGFVAQVGSEVYDASVIGQIHRFQASNS